MPGRRQQFGDQVPAGIVPRAPVSDTVTTTQFTVRPCARRRCSSTATSVAPFRAAGPGPAGPAHPGAARCPRPPTPPPEAARPASPDRPGGCAAATRPHRPRDSASKPWNPRRAARPPRFRDCSTTDGANRATRPPGAVTRASSDTAAAASSNRKTTSDDTARSKEPVVEGQGCGAALNPADVPHPGFFRVPGGPGQHPGRADPGRRPRRSGGARSRSRRPGPQPTSSTRPPPGRSPAAQAAKLAQHGPVPPRPGHGVEKVDHLVEQLTGVTAHGPPSGP